MKMLLPKNQLKQCLIQRLEKILSRNKTDDVTKSIKDVALETERVYYTNKVPNPDVEIVTDLDMSQISS